MIPGGLADEIADQGSKHCDAIRGLMAPLVPYKDGADWDTSLFHETLTVVFSFFIYCLLFLFFLKSDALGHWLGDLYLGKFLFFLSLSYDGMLTRLSNQVQ